MKIIVLSDNRAVSSDYETEHGLSIYLETESYKYLLDTGASEIFIRNAKKMNINLDDIDYVFLSHGHADHVGGLNYFLEINQKAKIVISQLLFEQQYFSSRNGFHEISVDFDVEKYRHRLILIDGNKTISDEIQVLTNISNKYATPKGNRHLMRKNRQENTLIVDDFSHEIIIVCGKQDLLVFTGCAHKGVLNILDTVSNAIQSRIRLTVGGFHLLDAKNPDIYENNEEINEICEILKRDYPDTYFITGHCTGNVQSEQLKKTLDTQIENFYVGYEYNLDDSL